MAAANVVTATPAPLITGSTAPASADVIRRDILRSDSRDSRKSLGGGSGGDLRHISFLRAHGLLPPESDQLSEGGESDSDNSAAQLSIGRGTASLGRASASQLRRAVTRHLRHALPPWDEGALESDPARLSEQGRLIVLPILAVRADLALLRAAAAALDPVAHPWHAANLAAWWPGARDCAELHADALELLVFPWLSRRCAVPEAVRGGLDRARDARARVDALVAALHAAAVPHAAAAAAATSPPKPPAAAVGWRAPPLAWRRRAAAVDAPPSVSAPAAAADAPSAVAAAAAISASPAGGASELDALASELRAAATEYEEGLTATLLEAGGGLTTLLEAHFTAREVADGLAGRVWAAWARPGGVLAADAAAAAAIAGGGGGDGAAAGASVASSQSAASATATPLPGAAATAATAAPPARAPPLPPSAAASSPRTHVTAAAAAGAEPGDAASPRQPPSSSLRAAVAAAVATPPTLSLGAVHGVTAPATAPHHGHGHGPPAPPGGSAALHAPFAGTPAPHAAAVSAAGRPPHHAHPQPLAHSGAAAAPAPPSPGARAAMLAQRLPWLTQPHPPGSVEEAVVVEAFDLTRDELTRFSAAWRPAWEAQQRALAASIADPRVASPHVAAAVVGGGAGRAAEDVTCGCGLPLQLAL